LQGFQYARDKSRGNPWQKQLREEHAKKFRQGQPGSGLENAETFDESKITNKPSTLPKNDKMTADFGKFGDPSRWVNWFLMDVPLLSVDLPLPSMRHSIDTELEEPGARLSSLKGKFVGFSHQDAVIVAMNEFQGALRELQRASGTELFGELPAPIDKDSKPEDAVSLMKFLRERTVICDTGAIGILDKNGEVAAIVDREKIGGSFFYRFAEFASKEDWDKLGVTSYRSIEDNQAGDQMLLQVFEGILNSTSGHASGYHWQVDLAKKYAEASEGNQVGLGESVSANSETGNNLVSIKSGHEYEGHVYLNGITRSFRVKAREVGDLIP
jgi:hypothetical protein